MTRPSGFLKFYTTTASSRGGAQVPTGSAAADPRSNMHAPGRPGGGGPASGARGPSSWKEFNVSWKGSCRWKDALGGTGSLPEIYAVI